MFNQLLYKMKQASVYIIIFWVIINIISSSACTGVREQTVFAHYPKYQVTKHELKIKRSSRYLSKKVLDFYEDCVHKYAPFCNWSSDTIVLEMMTSMVDHDVVCYAFSTTTDSLLFSDWNCFDNELKQTAYPSIEEYYSPSRIGIFPGNFVQERIASLKNIKYWQTDSIENKIKIGEPLLSSEIVYRLIRIVIKDKKITSVSTYDCDPLTFYS